MSILIISDNTNYSTMIQDVIHAVKPDETIEITRMKEEIFVSFTFNPNIILFDLDLFGHEHEQFLQELRRSMPLASINIIGLPPTTDLYVDGTSTCVSGRMVSNNDLFKKLAPIFSRLLAYQYPLTSEE